MSDLQISTVTLSTIRKLLDTAADGLEDTADSAPATIDAGDMTPLLTEMMAKVVSNAAAMSEGLSSVSAQVDVAGRDFWSTDATVSETFAGGLRVD